MTFSRQLAKQLRSVFRRALQISASQTNQVVWLIASADGLRIRAQNPHGIAEYHQPDNANAETDSFPVTMEALAACEGAKADESISVERRADGMVVLNWSDRDVPQQFHFDAKKLHIEPPPALPKTWGSNPPSLLGAMDQAMRIAPSDATRFAINCIQLRPAEGRIASTDARQLLVQSGFSFPWNNDVLVQRTSVFRCKELLTEQSVIVGATANHCVFRVGPWTLWLASEKQGRFPTFETVIPTADSATTRLRLSDNDVDYLLNVIPRLPTEGPDCSRVTLDLNGSVALLARGIAASPATQVILSNSQRQGDEVRLDTDREFLVRAIELGFREIELRGPESPVVCRDANRIYLWSPIAEVPAIVVGSDVVRLASPLATSTSHRPARHLPPPRCQHPPTEERTTPKMPRNRIAETLSGTSPPDPNQPATTHAATTEANLKQCTFTAVLEQAEAVKSALRQAHSKVNGLVAAIKRHRRQSKLMQSTLASLRQLQTLEV